VSDRRADRVREEVRAYLLDEFLAGEDPSTLRDDTRLVGGGILTSIDTIKLVAFLEDRYGIAFDAREVTGGQLATVRDIVAAVLAKRGA